MVESQAIHAKDSFDRDVTGMLEFLMAHDNGVVHEDHERVHVWTIETR